ncbi:PAS domain-containing protein [Pacificibacter sp. AS14]|uniref:PAS domain-containing protein n=1 Tax=Pacificibacter sp. AS14 TaxID=3135785 RepID=UPI00316F2E68
MTFQHSTSAFQSHFDEVRFDFEELFFSCTDERGLITSGNDVFQRVSGFEWDALLGAPHKVVRHPDMPKGVFHILWNQIQKGVPAGAYILNRCKDGKAYWVFAVIAPIESGFLSIRIKPSSELFNKTRELYGTLLEKEREGLSVEESAELFLNTLKTEGFDDYVSFGARAIGREIAARDSALSREPSKLTSALKSMSDQLLELSDNQEQLFEFFEAIRGIPSNMRIVASRLEPAGGPISAISQNYRLMSDEVQGHLDGFRAEKGSKVTVSSIVSAQVDTALLLAAMAQLLKELQAQCNQPNSETRVLNESVRENEDREKLLQSYSTQSSKAIKDASVEILRLARSSKDLRQLVTGLDSIRVLCRVEAGRLGADSVSLTPVIDQLDKFHKEIDKSLKSILAHAEKISELIDTATTHSVLSIDRFGRIS